MNAAIDEHERTLLFADAALGQIKALRHSAAPPSYEVWYNYATGHNPSLNQDINEMLAARGTLSAAEIDDIHARYFSPSRFTDRVEAVGGKVIDKIDAIMAVIDAAVGSATKHNESLADMSDQLGRAKDREAVRSIVKSLVQTVKDMEQTNQTLETRLTASKQEIAALHSHLEAVRTENRTDPLTTLGTRKYFDDSLVKGIAEAHERDEPLSLVMTDIDHFKTFNDSYGHLTGDQVLRLVALAVKQNVKGQDIAARYGGEEFAILLPETTLRAATTVADHIRRTVIGKELMKRSTGEHLGRISISAGVATLHRDDTAQSLIERADACLYAAKRAGRNAVVCETDPDIALSQMQVA